MISLSWDSNYQPNSYDLDRQIQALMDSYRALPRHIAKKHLKAAMRRVLKPGVPILRSVTPPLSTRRGRRKKGEKARSTGALRRSVTTKAGQTGRNTDYDAFVWGVLGYRYVGQDRKAIWLNYGTSRGVQSYDMIGKAMSSLGPISAKRLQTELAAALEKAANEVASGKNKGYGK